MKIWNSLRRFQNLKVRPLPVLLKEIIAAGSNDQKLAGLDYCSRWENDADLHIPPGSPHLQGQIHLCQLQLTLG